MCAKYSPIGDILVKEVDSVLKVGKELAEYIVELSYDDLSSEVTHQTSRVILDSLAVMYLGARALFK